MTHEAQAAVDPRLGSTLNERYRIVRKIGAGGMGIVYEGVHLLIQRRVAIKMLHAQFSQHAEVLMRFKREAIAATTIRHPHIVEVLDMGTAPDGSAYMVLEFLEGRDWSDDIEATGAQPLAKAARILRQVCDGLQAAHDKNIVHRDLKAENVFLAKHGSQTEYVKIVDFGISKMLDEPPAEGEKANHSLTKTGAAMGTPYAMAPEQMKGVKDIDHRADIWALGVMLYRAITGAYPFDGDTFPMLAVNVLTSEPRPLSDYRSDLPPQLQDIVSRLLNKDRLARFQHARELREALEPFESAAPTVATTGRPSFALGETLAPDSMPRTNVGEPAMQIVPAAGSVASAPSSVDPGTPLMSSAAAVHAALQSAGVAVPARETPSSIETKPAPEPSRASPGGPGMVTGVVLTVLLMTLGGGGVLVWLRMLGGNDTPSEHAPPASTVIAAPPPSTPPPSAPVSTVAIHVQATPDGAEVLLDGNPVSNPVDVDLPSGTTVHTLEVRASGYVSDTRELSAAFPQRISVALVPVSSGGTHRPRASTTPPPTTTIAAPPPETHVAPPPETHVDPPPTTTTEGTPPRSLRSPFGSH